MMPAFFRRLSSRVLVGLLLVALSAVSAELRAAPDAISSVSAPADDADELSLSFDDNIATPRVPQKAKARVRDHVAELAEVLAGHGYATAVLRDGEVLRLTIPCDLLFSPNSAVLKDTAAAALTPLKKYSRQDSPYKMVVAVHADDTGDSVYCDRLTADRASAIDSFFYLLLGSEETGVIPYGLGQDDFIGPNHSIEARAKNRRVEIYLVPRASLFQKQKK